jgi:hypothetical protein
LDAGQEKAPWYLTWYLTVTFILEKKRTFMLHLLRQAIAKQGRYDPEKSPQNKAGGKIHDGRVQIHHRFLGLRL